MGRQASEFGVIVKLQLIVAVAMSDTYFQWAVRADFEGARLFWFPKGGTGTPADAKTRRWSATAGCWPSS